MVRERKTRVQKALEDDSHMFTAFLCDVSFIARASESMTERKEKIVLWRKYFFRGKPVESYAQRHSVVSAEVEEESQFSSAV